MAKLMLLLYNDPSGWQKLSPEEMQKATEKYMAWMNKPFTVDSGRLAHDPGRVMRAPGGQVRTTDGHTAKPRRCWAVITRSRPPATTKPLPGRTTIRTWNTAAPSR